MNKSSGLGDIYLISTCLQDMQKLHPWIMVFNCNLFSFLESLKCKSIAWLWEKKMRETLAFLRRDYIYVPYLQDFSNFGCGSVLEVLCPRPWIILLGGPNGKEHENNTQPPTTTKYVHYYILSTTKPTTQKRENARFVTFFPISLYGRKMTW